MHKQRGIKWKSKSLNRGHLVTYLSFYESFMAHPFISSNLILRLCVCLCVVLGAIFISNKTNFFLLFPSHNINFLEVIRFGHTSLWPFDYTHNSCAKINTYTNTRNRRSLADLHTHHAQTHSHAKQAGRQALTPNVMESCTAHFIFTDQSINDITKTHCDYKVFVRVSLCVCLLVHHLNAVCIVLKINCCVFSRSMVFKLSSTRESEKIVTKYSDLENTTCRTTNTTRHNVNDFFLLVSFYNGETLRNN